ncbi:MAG: hypothetical protein Q9228_007655, partial [Teloschistes exilis]
MSSPATGSASQGPVPPRRVYTYEKPATVFPLISLADWKKTALDLARDKMRSTINAHSKAILERLVKSLENRRQEWRITLPDTKCDNCTAKGWDCVIPVEITGDPLVAGGDKRFKTIHKCFECGVRIDPCSFCETPPLGKRKVVTTTTAVQKEFLDTLSVSAGTVRRDGAVTHAKALKELEK